MHSFILILICLGIGSLSRLIFCVTNAVGKRTTPLGRFFLDFTWAATIPLLLFLTVLLLNQGVFVLHFPIFIALGFGAVHIVVGIRE